MTIILDNICKSYEGHCVLSNLQVEIEDGRCYAFVGPKGSGKTTALKIFMGLEKPDSGEVCRMGDYKYPTLHSAYVSQEGTLNLKKSAIWNVKKVHRFGSKLGAIKALQKLLPEDRLELLASELTEAEQRFVELVKVSLMAADFIVLDEPFRGMNEEEKKRAIDYILELKGSRPLLIASREEDDLSFAKKIRLGSVN